MDEPHQARPLVLVVDDSRASQQVLRGILEGMAEVVTASNGVEALAAVRERRPDLVLLDVVMPEMDGFETCRRLKADPATAGVPVIFVTSLGSEHDETRGLGLGAVDYVVKPYVPAVVRARIANHLMLQRAQRQLLEVNEMLQRLATTDPLTGAWNRRRFFEEGSRELQRIRRNRGCCAVLALDLDHFKDINDRHGHDVGDAALVSTVDVCRRELRRIDVLGRMGGEEFGVLLPGTDTAGGVAVAERIRRAVAETEVPASGDKVSWSVSIGVTEIHEDDQDLTDVLKRADVALYRAKDSGRNRVEF